MLGRDSKIGSKWLSDCKNIFMGSSWIQVLDVKIPEMEFTFLFLRDQASIFHLWVRELFFTYKLGYDS